MTTMKSKRRPDPGADLDGEGRRREVVDRLAGLLPEGALEDAVQDLRPEDLSGPGGLLSQLGGRVVEAALEAEMTNHLGHPPGGVPSGSNVRKRLDAQDGADGSGAGADPHAARPGGRLRAADFA